MNTNKDKVNIIVTMNFKSMFRKKKLNETYHEASINFLKNLIRSARKLPGCTKMELKKNIANKDSFILYEIWESEESLQTHINSEYFGTLSKFFAENTESISINKYVDIY